MSVTLDEKDLAKVESQKSEALNDLNKTYDGMVDDYTAKTDQLINESKNWVDTQSKLQNENYELEIKEIENQKSDAKKDYLKEQSGAYKDWQKQSNKYGAEAERQASMGMANSGYSESSQVAMYNNYQNRVAAARQAFVRSDTAYNLLMDRAKLQNDTLLAEIAYKGLQEELTLALESMQYKNSLLIQKSAEKRAIDSDYHTRWMSMYSQIKQQQQFDANMAFQREQFDWQKAQAEAKAGGSVKGYSGAGPSKKSSSSKNSKNSVKGATSSTIWPTPKKEKSNSNNSDSTGKKELKIDQKSVLALGQGPISEARLNILVASGQVLEIVDEKAGLIKFVYADPRLRNVSNKYYS